MTVSVLASGQIGSDSLVSPISGTHNPGASVVPDFVVVFVVGNGDIAASTVAVTYGGVAMNEIVGGYDGAGEGGQVSSYYLDSSVAIPAGSQTIEVTFSGQTAGSIFRIYCVSFASTLGRLFYLDNAQNSGDQTDPSQSFEIDAGVYASGAACLYYGGAASAVSVANGAQLSEADFSGGSQSASLIWANTTVTDGMLTMGWTAASDDVAAAHISFREAGNPFNQGIIIT